MPSFAVPSPTKSPSTKSPSPVLRRSAALAVLLLCCWTATQLAPPRARAASPGATTRPAAQEVPRRVPAVPAAHDGTDGLGPIILGLLLTGAAVYKHRGLPRGH